MNTKNANGKKWKNTRKKKDTKKYKSSKRARKNKTNDQRPHNRVTIFTNEILQAFFFIEKIMFFEETFSNSLSYLNEKKERKEHKHKNNTRMKKKLKYKKNYEE